MLKTIRHGAEGTEVKVAQYLIGAAERKSASGVYDANMVAAVTAWQRRHGLSPDGVIGPKTWVAVAENTPTCSTTKNRTSAATCALQLLLGGLDADGIFGSKTKNAVAAFQTARQLDVDGVCGQQTWTALIAGEETARQYIKPVDYKQYDSRWGSKMYSSTGKASQTVKSSGCGPTAAADVIATLVDESVTPWTLAQIALEKGYRTASNGTAWAFFKHIAGRYGIPKFVQTSNLATLKACLDAGGYVVCSMGPGYWTSAGHYICAWKYDGVYIYANDPASSKRTKQKQADFIKQRKQYFCFWPKG